MSHPWATDTHEVPLEPPCRLPARDSARRLYYTQGADWVPNLGQCLTLILWQEDRVVSLFARLPQDRHLRRPGWSWLVAAGLMCATPAAEQYMLTLEGRVRAEGGKVIPMGVMARLAEVYLATRDYARAYAHMQAYWRSTPEGRLAPSIRQRMAQIEASGVLDKQPLEEPQR